MQNVITVQMRKEPPPQGIPQLHKNSADKWSGLHHAL